MTNPAGEPRWLIDPYADWVRNEGVPVHTGISVDLTTADTGPWSRLDARGALVHLDARSDYLDLHLIEIPPGQAIAPQRHIYESVTYVIDGVGSTTVKTPSGQALTFEWQRGSMFAIPLNAEYRHFNGSGRQPARLASVTDFPLVVNLYRNEDFIFHNPAQFPERFGQRDFFEGAGTFIPTREHRHMWETNLIPNLLTFDRMQNSPSRGTGSTNIMFVLADATLHAHVSEIPVGRYKKAHRHQDGFHIFQLSGYGYSLYWNEGQPKERVDWNYGIVHGPAYYQWHQHFNLSDEPARYMAIALGSIRYPFTALSMSGWKASSTQRSADQIEYDDEEPEIAQTFERELERARKRS